ncbi:cytochrome C [Marnyiella aurantia]|uniref:Cytochrome C n=1 Tax=Marnyiella aurantia TaxID=2758037 RepID=A0A7D7QYP2_9FLAO|nr:cytochrome C [Marnyiella aurantia]MBA5245666.1 cytochrome C [Marnyiella aurantia]QMS98926.1 cytochrome C [Marnyiella aurantia]
MPEHNALVLLYIDDESNPVAELQTPVIFNLDTTKLTDGFHTLKIVSKFDRKEGVKVINFSVRNGPIIHIEGLSDNETVSGTLPLMLNAYDTGRNQSFIIKGSENPRTIPVWVWVIALVFVAWAAFYLVTNFSL